MENAADPSRSKSALEKLITGEMACVDDIPNRPTRPCAASRNSIVSTPASVTGTSANDL